MAIQPSGQPAFSGEGSANGEIIYAARHVAAPGNLNCDGIISYGDINPFVLLLSSHAAYVQQYRCVPGGHLDGLMSFRDRPMLSGLVV